MKNPADWSVLFIPLFVVLVWLGAMHFVAWIGGWKKLAAAYRFRGQFRGYRRRFVTGELSGNGTRIFPCNYGSSLTFGTNAEGLYMTVVPLFRLAHPPLFIPWNDVTAEVGRKWIFHFVAFTFRAAPGVRLRIARNVAESLIAAAGATAPAVLPADQ